jgi:hypothetical protein
LLQLSYVGADRSSGVPDFSDDVRQFGLSATDNIDEGALGGETISDGAPYSAASARDKRDSAFQLSHIHPFKHEAFFGPLDSVETGSAAASAA